MEPKELRCSACGAALHYEPGQPVIVCSHCATEYVVDEPTGDLYVEYVLEEAEPPPPIPTLEVPEAAEDTRPVYEPIVLQMLGAGKKGPAIKLVSSETGLSLPEAEELVDALAARHGIVIPEPGNKAWLWIAVTIIVLVGLAGTVAAFFMVQSG